MGGLLHLVQRGGARGRAAAPPSPVIAEPNVTPPINGQCTNHRIDV